MASRTQSTRVIAGILAIAGSAAAIAWTSPGAQSLAITNVTVIPMDRERTLPHETVIVRDGRIAAVGATSSLTIPADARRIDGTGRFLIPGLADAHVHYDNGHSTADTHVDEINRQYSELFLKAGVTTVMHLCGSPRNLAMRDSIARGDISGPRMFTSPGCLDDSTMTAAQGDSAAVASKAAGFDFLKVYSFLSRDGFRGIMAGARRVHIPVVGHIPQRIGLQAMLDAGAVGIVHAEEFLYNAPFRLEYGSTEPGSIALDTNQIPRVAHAVHAAGVTVTPTLSAYTAIVDESTDLDAVLARPEMKLVSDEVKQRYSWSRAENTRARRLHAPDALAKLRLGLAFQRRLVRAFRDSSIALLSGTDAGGDIPMVPGWSLHDELADLVTAGLTPYEALRTATANAGAFFGRQFHAPPSGTITPGARADLVLLDANPLTDIRNTRRIRGVVVRGKWSPVGDAS
jgi:imidazolonepropionase-like amidohydrolase